MSPYPQLLDSCSVLDVAVDLFVCLNSTTYTSLSNLIKLIWNPYLTITSMTKKFKHLRNKGDTHNFSLSVISESFSSSSEHTKKNTLSSRTRRWDYLFSLCVPQYFLYFRQKVKNKQSDVTNTISTHFFHCGSISYVTGKQLLIVIDFYRELLFTRLQHKSILKPSKSSSR